MRGDIFRGLYRGVYQFVGRCRYIVTQYFFLIVLTFFIAVVLISVLGFGGIILFGSFPFDVAVFKEGRRRALPAA